MGQILVSIVVPIYKAEEYLAQCMESIFAQTYDPLEVILVDDGSPDECPSLCDAYAAQTESVRVIHQENQGVGMARNAGIRAAKGDYICFVDPDDELGDMDSIAKMTACAVRARADIVQGDFCRLFPDESCSGVDHHHLRPGKYTRTADFRFKGFFYYGHLAYNWGKLYRRAFLTEHELYSGAYPFSQDKAHNVACYSYHPRYAFVDCCVYRYRVNEESVTFRYKDNLIPVWTSIAEDYLQFCRERGVKAYEDLMAFHIFFGSFFVAKQELLAGNGIAATRRALKRYGEIPLVRRYMRELSARVYTKSIRGGLWNAVSPVAAWFCKMHAYGIFAVGIALLLQLQVDKKITRSRHEQDQHKGNRK